MSKRGLDPDVIAELDRQYKAMEQSMRSYLDQRLAARAESVQPQRAAVDPRLWVIVGLVALVLIAGGGGAWWFYFRKPPHVERVENVDEPSTTTIAETPDDPPPPAQPVNRERAAIRAAVASAEADGQWAVSLKNLIEQQGRLVAAAMREADGNALADLAQRVEAGRPLTQAERAKVRVLLLEAIAEVKVDGNLRDVTPEVLSRLRGTYSVTTRSTDKTNMELQSEIILRWLESRAR